MKDNKKTKAIITKDGKDAVVDTDFDHAPDWFRKAIKEGKDGTKQQPNSRAES